MDRFPNHYLPISKPNHMGLPYGASSLTFETIGVPIHALAFAPFGELLAIAGRDGRIRVAIIHTTGAIGPHYELVGHAGPVQAVAFSPDGKWLASAGNDTAVKLWHSTSKFRSSSDAAEAAEAVLTYTGHTAPVCCLSWSPDGKRIVSAGASNVIQVWEASSGKLCGTYQGRYRHQVNAVAWSPDGKKILAVGDGPYVTILDPDTFQTVLRFKGHLEGALSAAWCPDSELVVTGGNDGTAVIWDLSTGEKVAEYKGHTGPVTSLAWFPDGESIASGSSDQTVQLWKASHAPLLIRNFRQPTFAVTSVVWSPPDGMLLASGSNQGSLHVWGP